MSAYKLLVSCEHASNRIPRGFRHLFDNAFRALQSHRGWDSGALDLATRIAGQADHDLLQGAYTRLLVDLNRSAGNPEVFSEWTSRLTDGEKSKLLSEFHAPYWRELTNTCTRLMRQGPVLHLGIHTFVRRLNGQTRRTDVGILFDPAHRQEVRFARKIQRELESTIPALQVDFNEPYLGTDDGIITAMRRAFQTSRYAGIEIEVCQDLTENTRIAQAIKQALA